MANSPGPWDSGTWRAAPWCAARIMRMTSKSPHSKPKLELKLQPTSSRDSLGVQNLKGFFGIGRAKDQQSLPRIRRRSAIAVLDVDVRVGEFLRNSGE